VAATVGAIVLAVAAVLESWAALGFEDLARYPDLLRRLAELEADESYSLTGVAGVFGLERTAGTVLSMVLGCGLLAGCVAYAGRGDDLRSFASAIAASLAFTPILWQHYLVLLAVPRPRFSVVWVLPVVLWRPRERTTARLSRRSCRSPSLQCSWP